MDKTKPVIMNKSYRLAHLLLVTVESLIYSALSKTLCLEIRTRPFPKAEIPLPLEQPEKPQKNQIKEPQSLHKRSRNKDENVEKLISPGKISEFFKNNPNSSRKKQKISEKKDIQVPIFSPEETLLAYKEVIEISESNI